VTDQSERRQAPDAGLAASEKEPSYGKALAGKFTLDEYKAFRSKLSDQTLSIEELHATFENMLQAEEAFLADLKSRFNATQMQGVARNLGQFGGRTKQDNAQSIYDALLRSFYLKDSVSYSPLQQTFKERLSELVPNQTADDLKSYYESKAQTREAERKIVENPETLGEYRELIRLKGMGQLTEQQLETYDRLAAQQSRKQRADAKPTQVSKFESEGLSESSFSIKQGFHDKKGCPLWIVQLTERVERDVYNELNRKAKMLGGWYSSFRKADAGFQFTSEDSAQKFAALLGSDADRTEELEGRKARREQSAAERLADVATRLLENAEQVLLHDQSKLKNTTRRAGMAAGMRGRAYADIALAKTVQSIADSMAEGKAEFLDGIRAKTQIETLNIIWRTAKQDHLSALLKETEEADRPLSYEQREFERDRLPNLSDVPFVALPFPIVYRRNLLEVMDVSEHRSGCVQISKKLAKVIKSMKAKETFVFQRPHEIELYQEFVDRAKSAGIEVKWLEPSLEDWKRLRAANIHTIEELRAAIRELAGHQAERPSDNPVTKAEDNLRGKQLPGFFPTPRPVINRMLELVQLKGTERVLEPSCGKGDILDAITEQFPDADVTGIEINRSLQEILEAKGYQIAYEDFLEHQGQYDCVVMNPPFEDGQEINHVRHAFSLLAPGGRLVSVMSEGPFFRSDSKSIAFRAWLDEVGAETESLPQNAFRGSEAFRETGVSTRIIVLTRPQ
jgi:protein-L-isoaspartate O-methyltransferase